MMNTIITELNKRGYKAEATTVMKNGIEKMRKISKEELKVILENHEHWLNEDVNCWEDMRADLSGADLSGANLRYANLRGADLRYVDLRGADLYNADLRYANLRGADLRYVDLRGAYLSGAKNIPFIPYACPDTGSFIGYKKAHGHIVELEILSDARRSSATERKCRCDKAKVLSIQNIDGTISELTEIASDRTNDFTYRVGEIVEEPNFCEDRWKECAEGIHFFINRQEAVDYNG